MTRWIINQEYSPVIQDTFSNIEKVISIKGEIVSASSISRVTKYHLEGKNFYIKHYFSKGKKLQKYFGRARWKTEWKNLLFCKKHQIFVPKIAAYGMKNSFYNLISSEGVIVTEEVPNAIDLKTIAVCFPHLLKESNWKKKVIQIIAQYIRTLHAANFIHYDLQWRNILVTTCVHDPQVYFFDIPSGGKRFFSFQRGIIRDFYNLYKNAWKYLSRTEQLRFFLFYKNKNSLNQKDKKQIKKILAYFWKKERDDLVKESLL